jgi:thiamine-phosphate pyrophosphorylase
MIKYLITDPEFWGEDEKSFKERFFKIKPFDFILYRNKITYNYKKSAKIFVSFLKRQGINKIIIHQNPLLAKELGVLGVHLTSKQFQDISLAKQLKLFTIISTHTIDEVQKAYDLKVDAVTFSPIFFKEGKGKPKEINQLKEVVQTFPTLKIFALGGIVSEREVEKIESISNIYGFASIRFFI